MVYWIPGAIPKLSGAELGAIGEKGSSPAGKLVIRACAATLEAATGAVVAVLPPCRIRNACMKMMGTLTLAVTCTNRKSTGLAGLALHVAASGRFGEAVMPFA